jgi:hypothetical protein
VGERPIFAGYQGKDGLSYVSVVGWVARRWWHRWRFPGSRRATRPHREWIPRWELL